MGTGHYARVLGLTNLLRFEDDPITNLDHRLLPALGCLFDNYSPAIAG